MRSAGGTLWKPFSQNISAPGHRAVYNVLVEQPWPTHYAKQRISVEFVTAWRLMIDDTILRHIQKCTEAEAHRKLGHTKWNLSLQEIEKFISILYARGACGCKNISVNDLWTKKWGNAFFSKTMPRDRFKEIMRYIRFDVRAERSIRLQTDKFALISHVWNRFIDNCKSCYRPGENITIDEKLFPTKARCKFTQYMANKPDKFGIKFWLCVDVKSKYLLNGIPYLGKDDNRPSNLMLGEGIVIRLVNPYINKGRNVTTDNFFTPVSLAQNLLSKRTTLVGTINRARRDIPPYVKKLKLNLHAHEVLKTENNQCLLTVYQAKSKNVLVSSTLHDTVFTDEVNNKGKPNTVTF